MIFPWRLSARLASYLAKNRLQGRKRFPLVLMLEPTFRCNLVCAGCGRIREYHDVLDRWLSVEECLEAAEECAAPVVSITGGEPLLHPEIASIVAGLAARKRFVYLCTNGILLEKSLHKFTPGPYLSFVLHLDGTAATHDVIAGQKGVFDRAIRAIKAAKGAGFQVCTNTTVYKGTDPQEMCRLFHLLGQIGTDGIMVSPAFSYEAVDNDLFLSRLEVHALFQALEGESSGVRFYNTPIYREFLAGSRELLCTPWSNPTRNPKGWKRPCYLITDGHCASFQEFMEEAPWEKYGVGNDPRCANCMVHYGFEASAIDAAGKTLSDLWRMVRWNFLSG